jgi:hypothetical protein
VYIVSFAGVAVGTCGEVNRKQQFDGEKNAFVDPVLVFPVLRSNLKARDMQYQR